MRICVLVPAAGRGKRARGYHNKLLHPLCGKPVLAWSLEIFQQSPLVEEILLAAPEEDLAAYRYLTRRGSFHKVREVIVGGAERHDSVRKLLQRAAQEGLVAVHDGARPLVSQSLLHRVVEATRGYDGAVPGIPVVDTIKMATEEMEILETLPREKLWAIQTPQVFPFEILIRAYTTAEEEGFVGTDDSTLVERIGGVVKIVAGSRDNIKITTSQDFLLAEILLQKRLDGRDCDAH